MKELVEATMDYDFDAHSRQILIDGRSLNYLELGDPTAPVLLYVHGLMGTWRNWIFNLLPFADRFRVIAVDLPGFGDSQMPAGRLTIENYAKTLTEFIAALGVERVTYVGNSMGGLIGSVVAKKTPEFLERLILVDAAGISTSTRMMQRISRLAPLLDFFFTTNKRVQRFIAFNRWLAAALTKIVLHKPMKLSGEVMMLLLAGLGKAGFVPAVKAITHTPVSSIPGEIKVETTIIWGLKDLLVPKGDAFRYSRMIPHARLVLLEEVGHIPMFETPEEFNAIVEEIVAPQGEIETTLSAAGDAA